MSDPEITYQSQYPELKLPEGGFSSKIPPHLLEGADEQMRWLMNEMSKNTQATEWTCHSLIDTNRQVRKTNGRLLGAEASLKEDRAILDELKTKAAIAEPFLKPVSLFMRLWDYQAFRWIFYIAAFFVLTYVLPWYIANPISLKTLFTFLFGV